MDPKTKKYETPKLDRFGTISELSAGGSGAMAENMPGNPSAPGQQMMQFI